MPLPIQNPLRKLKPKSTSNPAPNMSDAKTGKPIYAPPPPSNRTPTYRTGAPVSIRPGTGTAPSPSKQPQREERPLEIEKAESLGKLPKSGAFSYKDEFGGIVSVSQERRWFEEVLTGKRDIKRTPRWFQEKYSGLKDVVSEFKMKNPNAKNIKIKRMPKSLANKEGEKILISYEIKPTDLKKKNKQSIQDIISRNLIISSASPERIKAPFISNEAQKQSEMLTASKKIYKRTILKPSSEDLSAFKKKEKVLKEIEKGQQIKTNIKMPQIINLPKTFNKASMEPIGTISDKFTSEKQQLKKQTREKLLKQAKSIEFLRATKYDDTATQAIKSPVYGAMSLVVTTVPSIGLALSDINEVGIGNYVNEVGKNIYKEVTTQPLRFGGEMAGAIALSYLAGIGFAKLSGKAVELPTMETIMESKLPSRTAVGNFMERNANKIKVKIKSSLANTDEMFENMGKATSYDRIAGIKTPHAESKIKLDISSDEELGIWKQRFENKKLITEGDIKVEYGYRRGKPGSIPSKISNVKLRAVTEQNGDVLNTKITGIAGEMKVTPKTLDKSFGPKLKKMGIDADFRTDVLENNMFISRGEGTIGIDSGQTTLKGIRIADKKTFNTLSIGKEIKSPENHIRALSFTEEGDLAGVSGSFDKIKAVSFGKVQERFAERGFVSFKESKILADYFDETAKSNIKRILGQTDKSPLDLKEAGKLISEKDYLSNQDIGKYLSRSLSKEDIDNMFNKAGGNIQTTTKIQKMAAVKQIEDVLDAIKSLDIKVAEKAAKKAESASKTMSITKKPKLDEPMLEDVETTNEAYIRATNINNAQSETLKIPNLALSSASALSILNIAETNMQSLLKDKTDQKLKTIQLKSQKQRRKQIIETIIGQDVAQKQSQIFSFDQNQKIKTNVILVPPPPIIPDENIIKDIIPPRPPPPPKPSIPLILPNIYLKQKFPKLRTENYNIKEQKNPVPDIVFKLPKINLKI